jgi:lysophospholipase L1-like esterase
MWNTLADDFPGLTVINRGVGGCRLEELVEFAPRLVSAARPRVIVVSAGTNDIADGRTTESIRAAFERLVAVLRREQPEATIVFLAISPTVKRWDQVERQTQANAAVKAVIDTDSRGDLVYLDTNSAFLGPDGLPAPECFLDDLQHPSTIGNSRRAELMRPVLENLLLQR